MTSVSAESVACGFTAGDESSVSPACSERDSANREDGPN